MLFNSTPFILFLVITFTLYYLPLLKKVQLPVLILASLFFYANENPILLLLLLGSALINIVASYLIVYGDKKYRKFIAISGVLANILILSFFKYSQLLATTFFSSHSEILSILINIPLPIGISFFTFEGISLVVDVFNEKDNTYTEKSFSRHSQNTLLFISFFPHLIAGPILKANAFLPQIEFKAFRQIQWEQAFRNILIGYFLKLVVADNLKDFTYWMEYPYFQSRSSTTLITLLFGYSCQIFADFAGYSLIAIGLAKLFGYNFNPNFNFPYISTSFSEFWKRWHISLSSFLKEYLYIPMGGNKKGNLRTYFNLLFTMVLGGLWHGASWGFAVWGGAHGICLVIERLITQHYSIKNTKPVIFFQRILIFISISLLWLLFKISDFSAVLYYLNCIQHNWYKGIDIDMIQLVLLYSSPIFLYHLAYLLKAKHPTAFYRYEPLALGIMLFLIIFNSGSQGSFIYFQF
jgi:alginate O-acetyltransferase complex protein AlgI